MDIVILLLFCYLLHKKANKIGIRPWPWLIRYALVWMLISTLITVAGTRFMGLDFSQVEIFNLDPEIAGQLAILGLINLGLCTLAFLLFYKHIQKLNPKPEEPEDEEPEKDLSYFR